MPQATPARNTDRDRLRSRPSAVARTESAENAPVLFRFPAIAVTDTTAAAESLPTPPAPPVGESSIAASQSDAVASMQAASLLAAAGAIESRSNNGFQAQTHTAQPAAVPATVRSWWDHWSSGVVLILLIIALVAASILALNDGSKSPPDQLADQSLTAAIDEFDLSNITIPEVAISQPADIAKHVGVTSSGHGSESRNSENDGAGNHGSESRATKTENKTETKTETPKPELMPNTSFTLESQLELTSSPTETGGSPEATGLSSTSTSPVATKSEQVSTAHQAPQATLALPADSNRVADKPGSTPKSSTNNSAAPLATLALPVNAAPLPLFDPNEKPKAEVDTGFGLEKPVTSLTAGSQNLIPNTEIQSSQAASQPAQSMPGSSPTLYDGAARTASAVATSGPVDTNLPSYATILASATAPSNPGPVNYQTGNVPAAVAPQLQAGLQPTLVRAPAGSAQPTIVSSATPDFDTTALIKAYLPYSQMTQASNGVLPNRYPAATGQAATGQAATGQAPVSQQSSQQAVQAGGIGFTLGN